MASPPSLFFLSEDDLARLRAGHTIIMDSTMEIHPLLPADSSPPFYLPHHLGPNQHVRIWSANEGRRPGEGGGGGAANTTTTTKPDTDLELAYDNTWTIYGHLRYSSVNILSVSLSSMLLLGRRAHGTDLIMYSVVSFTTQQAEQQHHAAHGLSSPSPSPPPPAMALMFGPTSLIPSLFDANKDHHHHHPDAKQVCVAFSAPPLPEPASTATHPTGDYRGYSNMPPVLLRTTMLDLEEATITPDAWVDLLHFIGKLVDLLGLDNAVELACRETYYPPTGKSLHRAPMVVITASPRSVQLAQVCMYHTQHILCTYNYNQVQVMMCIGRVSRACNHGVVLREGMGASIGPKDSISRGGTSGGFVTLSGDGSPVLCAITNHHVAVNNCKKVVYNPNAPPSHAIDCPTMPFLRGLLHTAEKKLSRQSAELGLSRNLHLVNTLSKEVKEIMIREEHFIYEKRKEVVESIQNRMSNVHFGYVIASSGLVQKLTPAREGDPNDHGRLVSEMDWALIKVDPGRIPTFPYNKADHSYTSGTYFGITGKALEGGFLHFESISLFLQRDRDTMVSKINRYSETDYGYLSKFRARTHFDGNAYGGLVYVVSHDKEPRTFGREGDSGSWVLGAHGNVVGLYMGVTTREVSPGSKYGSAFILDIQEVIDHIQSETDCTVSIANTEI